MAEDSDHLKELVADVAAAYFSNSHVAPADIPHVIGQIAASLKAVAADAPAAEPEAATESEETPPPVKLTAAQIRKSITPDAIISFEDGKGYKTLKRHLGIRGMTPAEYKAKWGLPKDYPVVSPNYSAARSAMAKSFGLGAKGKGAKPAAKPRGRKAAAAS